ncbi:MAG: YicC family protein [Rhizobacter sp.]|nr:YicC family protein [Chlorobiales bacterium]
MIESMTGYGHAEANADGLRATAEIRSVNNRFAEISVKLPRQFSSREQEAKDLIRKELQRGKISATLLIEREMQANLPIRVKPEIVKSYTTLLENVRSASGIMEPVKMEHLLRFSEIFESNAETPDAEVAEWQVITDALTAAIAAIKDMRRKEGLELKKDFVKRLTYIGETLERVEKLSIETLAATRDRLRDKVKDLLTDESVISRERLEMEILLLADKMDITEECVRFRSHNKFFLEALESEEPSGRKLNFLMQEQGREANTIASKSQNAEIAHLVVSLKEELEKMREQIQNIE